MEMVIHWSTLGTLPDRNEKTDVDVDTILLVIAQ